MNKSRQYFRCSICFTCISNFDFIDFLKSYQKTKLNTTKIKRRKSLANIFVDITNAKRKKWCCTNTMKKMTKAKEEHVSKSARLKN